MGGDALTLLEWVIVILRVALPVLILPLFVVPLTWLERRGAALIQDRPGPNRVGPFGLVQPIADMIKMFFKEAITPTSADKFLYLLAPAIAVFAALSTFAVVPYGSTIHVSGREIPMLGADLSIGILYIFAITSLSVYAIVLAGWASNSKFSLMGGIRSSAQIISYELAMTTAAAGVILASSSFRLSDVIATQQRALPYVPFLPQWNILIQPVGFLVFFISAFAETNRLPFDLPEAEAELVAGYHTEYSAMRFGAFQMAEYVNVMVVSAITTTLYFGGWSLPGFHPHGVLGAIASLLIFMAKSFFFVCVFIWVRWTLPRFRYDQLMKIGWKALLPLALANLLWIAALEMWRMRA
jgi:NADH-quinone oxidoreductase subunit H